MCRCYYYSEGQRQKPRPLCSVTNPHKPTGSGSVCPACSRTCHNTRGHTFQTRSFLFRMRCQPVRTHWLLYVPSTLKRSRDSSVGIATGYRLDDRGFGVRVPVESRIFSSPRRPDRFWGPPSLLPNGYRGLFPRGVKRPGREADHSPTRVRDQETVNLYRHFPIRLHGAVLN
jgi:hypothetical protein